MEINVSTENDLRWVLYVMKLHFFIGVEKGKCGYIIDLFQFNPKLYLNEVKGFFNTFAV